MLKLSLVILTFLSFSLHAETKMNFSGDAFVRGYFLNGTGADKTQAFNQFFRLNLDAKPDNELTIKTGLVLSGNTWEGDNHATTATSTGVEHRALGSGDTTRLDHASLDYVKNGYVTTIGRVAVTSPGSFLTSDDRRDRVQVLKFMPTGLWAFVYDKRSEGTLANSRDDLDMFSVNYYGKAEWFNYAIQTGYWTSRTTYTLKDLKQFTPQLDGNLLGVHYNLYYTLLFGGATKNTGSAYTSSYYTKSHHAAALVLAKDVANYKVSYQSIVTSHGGLIAGGYDTFSSIVNNNPDYHQSSTNLRNIGSGFGRNDANENMHMFKVSHLCTPDIFASISAGVAKLYVWNASVAASKFENLKIVDASVKFTLSNALSLDTSYGKFFGDNEDHAGSLTLNARF